jgi:hypothetical protein
MLPTVIHTTTTLSTMLGGNLDSKTATSIKTQTKIMKSDLEIPEASPLKSALSNLIACEGHPLLDPLWDEAEAAWVEGGHADEAKYDRAKANSQDEWLSSWVEAELRKRISSLPNAKEHPTADAAAGSHTQPTN